MFDYNCVDKTEVGVYVHVPFCKTKCSYCDFYRITDNSKIDAYVKCLKQEILDSSYKGATIKTIYIGGGTPSLLGGKSLLEIINVIKNSFNCDFLSEITIECNPDDIDYELASYLRKADITRISIGVQSLDDKMLRLMNRRHNSKKVYESIQLLRNCGFNNISVDFIYGLPLMDTYSFIEDVEKIISLNTEHISAYALSYEEGSIFSKLLSVGKISTITDDEIANQYDYLVNALSKNKFYHYELSNFCKENSNDKLYYASRHNIDCWDRKPYIGFGPGAYSFFKDKRWNNSLEIDNYIRGINNVEIEKLNDTDIYNEIVMLGLRTKKGISIDNIPEDKKKYFFNSIQKFLRTGKLVNKNNMYYIPESEWFILDLITEDIIL